MPCWLKPKRCVMLWEVDIQPKGPDRERDRVCDEYHLLTHSTQAAETLARTAHGYLLEGDLTRSQVERLVAELLVDPLVETGRVTELTTAAATSPTHVVTVLLKPGVMDPVALSVVDAAQDLGLAVADVRTFRRYYF